MFGPGPRIYEDGAFVRTPLGRTGRVVGAYVEREPQHDDMVWDDGWITAGDEIVEHVYLVELPGSWEPEVQPWPGGLLDPSSVLDMLI